MCIREICTRKSKLEISDEEFERDLRGGPLNRKGFQRLYTRCATGKVRRDQDFVIIREIARAYMKRPM